MADAILKLLSDNRTYYFDFSNLPEILAGDTLSSVVSATATPSDLVLGSAGISGNLVSVPISGGTANTTYTIVVYVLTAGGSEIGATGLLYVNGG